MITTKAPLIVATASKANEAQILAQIEEDIASDWEPGVTPCPHRFKVWITVEEDRG